jgi:hypothetical protein
MKITPGCIGFTAGGIKISDYPMKKVLQGRDGNEKQ